MTFLLNESAAISEPIELFVFARGSDAWYFTSHTVDVTRDGIVYRASLASRDAFKQSEESAQSTTVVNIARRHPLATLLLKNGLNDGNGTIYLQLALTTEGDTDKWPVWIGEVTDLVRHDTHAELHVASAQNLMKRPMLRVVGGTQCNHALYDTGCGMKMDDYRTDTIVTAVGGRVIQLDAVTGDSIPVMLRGGSFAGGLLIFNKRKWFIERNILFDFTLMTPMDATMVGETVSIYKGCSRSYDVCLNRFNNTRNFGGFPKWPVTSPFDNAD